MRRSRRTGTSPHSKTSRSATTESKSGKTDDSSNKTGKTKENRSKRGSSRKKNDMDEDREMDPIIEDKDPLTKLRKECDQDVSLLSQFLSNNNNNTFKKLLLYGDSDDCDSGCENN